MQKQRVNLSNYRLDGAETVSQVKVHTGDYRIVATRISGRIQVEADRIFQFCEGSIVEECRLQRDVAQK